MDLLKEEFSRLAGDSQLYTDGFMPEQIFYQLQELCASVIERSEGVINELLPLCEKMAAGKDKKICALRDSTESERADESDVETIDEASAWKSTCSSSAEESTCSSTGDELLDMGENEMNELSADRAMRLLYKEVAGKKKDTRERPQ
jgi:hypothetical protein